MDRYQPIAAGIWNGRVDNPTDQLQFRMHQWIKPVNLYQAPELETGFSLLGYACDEGVKRNKGRIGAQKGPSAFRQAFASMALHTVLPVHDLGNVFCSDGNMEATQNLFADAVSRALDRQQKVIGIGGGHDVAYAHYKGIQTHSRNDQTIGIINLDAHLDLREPNPENSSGTPFWQISRETAVFQYCCIGAHNYANTRKLFAEAEALGAMIIGRQSLRRQNPTQELQDFIDKVEVIYLTIDLDGMDMSVCPGVSAPVADGLLISEVLPILQQVGASKKLASMDIAELNPDFDPYGQTAKIAAYLAHTMMAYWT